MGAIQGIKQDMWLYASTDEIDLKVNKALHKAKRAIVLEENDSLLNKANINAAGQQAIEADLISEQVFLQTLEDEKLAGVVYSEESGVKHFGDPEIGDPMSIVLLLDPLDGSQNYLKGLPVGCISVAYGPYTSNPRLNDLNKASIMNLYAEEVFFAEKDNGVWFNGNALPTAEDYNFKDFSERNIQISYYAYGSNASQYYFDFQDEYSLRSLGSAAWELVLVASNRNDAFADVRGVLKTHDFAAAKLMIEELGGTMHFFGRDNDTIDQLLLGDFTSGFSVLASLDQYLLQHLLDDFEQHGLV